MRQRTRGTGPFSVWRFVTVELRNSDQSLGLGKILHQILHMEMYLVFSNRYILLTRIGVKMELEIWKELTDYGRLI